MDRVSAITAVAASAVFLSFLSADASGLPETIPVTGMKGRPEDHNRVSGLAFTVEDAGWPLLSSLLHVS